MTPFLRGARDGSGTRTGRKADNSESLARLRGEFPPGLDGFESVSYATGPPDTRA